MKISGYEWKQYWNNNENWKDGYWVDDLHIFIDDFEAVNDDFDFDLGSINDSAQVNICGGYIYNDVNDKIIPLKSHFKKWYDKQNNRRIIIEVNKNDYDNILKKLKKIGIFILGDKK